MQTIVGVRFKKAGKIYYFSPGRHEIAHGDEVIVETVRGVECGRVVLGPREVEEAGSQPLKTVQRKATEKDLQKVEESHRQEKEAFKICEKKIRLHGLPRKLGDVEYTFARQKMCC